MWKVSFRKTFLPKLNERVCIIKRWVSSSLSHFYRPLHLWILYWRVINYIIQKTEFLVPQYIIVSTLFFFHFQLTYILLRIHHWIKERKRFWDKSEFHAPLHKQLITLPKFNIPISIDISIKTHQFDSRYCLTFKSTI